MIRIFSMCMLLVAATRLFATPENVSESQATLLPKFKVRANDLDMTITADPKTGLVLSIIVDEVIPNSEAARLGLRDGYQIEKVAGIPVTKLRFEDVDGDKLNQGQAIKFVSPKIFGIYRKVITVSFTRKTP
jgi:hypothetical protein